MNKKWFALLALTTALGSLTACSGEEREKPVDSPYKNGVYNVEWGGADENGWRDYLALQIDDGTLTVLEFDAKDENGTVLSDSDEAKEAMALAHTTARLPALTPKMAHQTAVDSLVSAGGDPEQMELVAGATNSCRSLQVMVRELLATNAQTGEKGTCTVSPYLDGSYTVSEPAYDEDGWKAHLTLTVSGGNVTIDQFDAVNQENALRSTEKDDTFGAMAAALTESFKTTGSVNESTCEDEAVTALFQRLLSQALRNARYRGPNEDLLPTLVNGEYRAEMSQYENGWKDYLVLVVSGDRVTVKEFDGKNETGEHKRSHAAWQQETGGWNASEKLDAIAASFKAANSNVTDMENVAGATVSCNNFRLMAGELLGYSAVTGDTATLVVDPVGADPAPSSSGSSSTPAQDASSSEGGSSSSK